MAAAPGRRDVVVQVAVTQVAEGDQLAAGESLQQGRIGARDEFRDAGHGQRDVVLDVLAGRRLGQRDMLAQLPQAQGLRAGGGEHGVARDAAVEGGADARFQQRRGVVFRLAARQFHQGVLRIARGERVAQLGEMGLDQLQAEVRHQFEARQRGAALVLQQAEQRQRMARRFQRDQGAERRLGLRVELEHGGRDDAQRPLGADEQVAQVVAGIVLAQAAQAVPDFALGGDHFQAQAQFPRVPVAQDGGAAGIGRQVPADGAAAFRRQRQGKQHAGAGRGLLDVVEDAAGFHRHGAIGGIEGADTVQAPQRNDDGRAAGVRHAAQHQAGAAALRHHRDAGGGAGAHHGGHLLGIRGQHHGAGAPGEAAAPVGEEGRHVGLLAEDVGVAGDGAALRQQRISHAAL